MQIVFRCLRTKSIDDLFVSNRTKRRDGKHLRLTSRKETRTVCTRQNTNLTADGAHLIQRTSIRTDFFVRNHVADDPLFDLVEDLSNLFCSIRIFLDEMLHGLRLDGRNICITRKLVAVPCCGIKALLCIRTHLELQFLGNSKNRGSDLFFSTGTPNIVLKLDKTTNLSMTEQDRIKNDLFGKFVCTRLHHHNSIVRTGHGEIQLRNSTLRLRRIDNKRTINITDTHARNRSHKGDIRYGKCTGGTDHRSDFRRIVLLHGENGSNDLDIVPKAIGEKRANGAINQARTEHGIAARTSLSLDEATWNLSCSIHLFFVIHRQRKEVNALTWGTGSCRCDQNNSVAIANQDSSIRLLCHLPVLDGQRSSAQLHLKALHTYPPRFLRIILYYKTIRQNMLESLSL